MFGVANGVLAFVPRMIESGEPGVVVNTSSGDGGIAPVPYASVYASSKAAISCFTESLAHQLRRHRHQRCAPRCSIRRVACSTPVCGPRNATDRLSSPASRSTHPGPVTTFAEFRERLAAMGKNADVADLRELGRFVRRRDQARAAS